MLADATATAAATAAASCGRLCAQSRKKVIRVFVPGILYCCSILYFCVVNSYLLLLHVVAARSGWGTSEQTLCRGVIASTFVVASILTKSFDRSKRKQGCTVGYHAARPWRGPHLHTQHSPSGTMNNMRRVHLSLANY